MESHQKHRQGVDQPLRRVRAQALAEQGPVGQGPLQMQGDQAGVQLPAIGGGTPADDAQGHDTGLVDLVQEAQHVVFAGGEVCLDLLDRDDRAGELDEPHDVPGDTAWEGCKKLGGPVLQRQRPRQVEHCGIQPGCGDLKCHSTMVARQKSAR